MRYFRSGGGEAEDFRLAVEREFTIERESPRRTTITPLDTFDWRLFNRDYFAYATPGSFMVEKHGARSPLMECEIKKVPRFWWEFEDGTLRAFLEPITGDRALLPLATLKIDERKHLVRNEDGKIVGRFSLLKHAAGGDEAQSYLLIDPLRGYAHECDSLVAMAGESGMQELPHPFPAELLMAHGIQPGDYSSKFAVALSKTQTITEAAQVIHRHLLSTMRSNIPGIIEDYDTEFLHDFRVATRRTRACLSQVKEAFPQAAAEKYNADFKTIAQRCNVLRDLDVYLLEKQRYYDMLPEHLHAGLDRYFTHIKRRRTAQQRSFATYLQSEAFTSILEDWGAFLENPLVPADSPLAIEVARSRMRASYRRIIKRGRRITPASPDKDLHSLRINCKKLRYLLEFFTSLFPHKKMNALIKHLKDLQDVLGEFNDLVIQQKNLSAYLQRPNGNAHAEQLVTAAIGGLLTVLNTRQHEARDDFFHTFKAFDSQQVDKICKELFGSV